MTDAPDAADADLLEQFARDRSEAAFAALVERHIGLVHSVALRHTANPQHAQDITQAVFIILARKANKLARHTVLAGWLYHTARLTAANFQRAEIRRIRREQEAYMQSTLTDAETANAWTEIAPLLDEAMSRLRAGDRDALVLRYFQNKSLAEVGATMGLQERAAQKRVLRAIEKLRTIFAKQGVTGSTDKIAETIYSNSVQAISPALIKAVTVTAITKGATISASTLTLAKGALKIMAWTKAKIAITAAVAVVLTAGVSTIVVEKVIFVDGKTESQWIHSIKYGMDLNDAQLSAQLRTWRSLGPRGIRMLVHGLKNPEYGHSTRMCIADLLSRLGNDAKGSIPDIINQIKIEKDDPVRQIEIGYFEETFKSMPEKDKTALFPELVRAMQSNDSGVRHNALVILRYYTNQQDTIVPLMVEALQDSDADVRLMAAKALYQADPQTAVKSDIVRVVTECYTNSNTANDAVNFLGELHRDPELSVPLLIQALENDKSYIRNNAAWALGQFGAQAKSAIPALTKALSDTDSDVRRQAASALKKINASR